MLRKPKFRDFGVFNQCMFLTRERSSCTMVDYHAMKECLLRGYIVRR